MCMCFSVLPWEQAYNDTSKNLDWIFFFLESKKTLWQNKTGSTAGGPSEPSLFDKGPVNHDRGWQGWHTLTKQECMANETSGKTQITLNWCSVGVTDKGFHKKEEWDQPKNGTGVKASSHGYWTSYNGVHEEKSLIQAKVHFTVVLALRVWDWETFHSQRPRGRNSYGVGLSSTLWPGCQRP